MGDDLPEGWIEAAITDICELNPPKPAANAVSADCEVTFVPMPAVDADARAITSPQVRTFEEVRKGFTSFRDNDVILAKITPCFENGKVAICRRLLNGLGFGSTEFHVLRSNGTVLPEYVYRFVQQDTFLRDGEANMTGSVGQKRVPAAWLGALRIPVPPLAEQRRIVAAVEALLARVQAARPRLAKVPALLKRFRQSVLAAACSGGLTADWREKNPEVGDTDATLRKIENDLGRCLLPCDIDSLPFEIPASWRYVQSQDLCRPSSVITYGVLKPVWVDNGIRTVRVQDIQAGQIAVNQVAMCCPKRAERFAKTTLEVGDLLIAKDGATLGKTAFVPPALHGGNITQHVLRFPLSRRVEGVFVRFVIDSRHGQEWMRSETKGVALPGVNVGDFRRMPIPLPPLAEQHEIVRRVEALFALADKIEARVAAATARVEKITQAILAKAFRGELVPTEAELARQEGRDYEPASVLLERIRAERAHADETPNAKGKRSARRS